MASYTVDAGDRGVHGKTLVAATADTVTISTKVHRGYIEIVNENTTSAISATTDGTTPTADADTAYYVPPNSVKSIPVSAYASSHTVKLISAGTPKYSVVIE